MSSITGHPKYYSIVPDPVVWGKGQRILFDEWQKATDRGDHRTLRMFSRAIDNSQRKYCCIGCFVFGVVGVVCIISGSGVMGGDSKDTRLIVIGSIFVALSFFGMCISRIR